MAIIGDFLEASAGLLEAGVFFAILFVMYFMMSRDDVHH